MLRSTGTWEHLAKCLAEETAVFYGARDDMRMSGIEIRKAKSICRACPVRRECLVFALESDQAWGVWGGLTAAERERAMLYYEHIMVVLSHYDDGTLEKQVVRGG